LVIGEKKKVQQLRRRQYSMGCPAIVQYKVVFSDGRVLWPKLPGNVNVFVVASQYAKDNGIEVVSIN